MMRFIFMVLVLLLCVMPVAAQQPVTNTPDSSVRLASADIQVIPAETRPYIRYLSLYNIPKDQRRSYAQTVSFVIHSLSRRKQHYIPVFVGNSDETVIRLNLKDYNIDPKIWDELGEKGSGPRAFPEPYFHSFATEIIPVETADVVLPDKVKRTATKVIRRRKYMPAPWVDAASLAMLYAQTKSTFPMYRADWFNVNATVEPLYHKFLDLGETIKTFEKAVFADEELAKKAHSQYKAVVIKSQVARNNRTLTRSPTFTDGYIWISNDTLKSVDDRNYAQNILDEQFDANEIIASLPNGLQAYFVTNGKGERQDKADNEIAKDYLSADAIVRNGRSCMACHAVGINPIQDEVRELNKRFQNKEQVRLLVASEEDYYRIQDLFSSNLDLKIVRDQQIYADAIGLVTGLTPEQNAQAHHAQWENYIEHLMTVQQVALDCGISVQEVERYCRLSGDNLFLGLTKTPIRPVRRDQFEQAFQSFMLIVMREKYGVNPAALLDPVVRVNDTIQVVGVRAEVFKPSAEEPCAIVPAGTKFKVIRVHEDLYMIETQNSGRVWIEAKNVKKTIP